MSTSSETRVRHLTQMLGALGLALLLLFGWLLIADYGEKFKPVDHITVESDRSGLLLDKGARVRLSGVPVGEVRGTKVTAAGTVDINVALDKDQVAKIPSNVTAAIHGTTVFGSKFVDLEVPKTGAAPTAINAGAVLHSGGVTVEANDVFQNGIRVLEAVKPTELNAILSSVASALNGRGDKLGNFFTDWNRYLNRLDPHLPALEADLSTATGVTKSYADAAPALIDAANNFRTTARTLLSFRKKLDALLPAVDTAADSAGALLNALEAPLVSFIDQWQPVSALLMQYAPEYDCVVRSLERHVTVFDRVFGKQNPDEHYFYGSVGFLPGQEAYTFAKNAPRYVAGTGPRCYPRATAKNPYIPHVAFRDGTSRVYSNASTGKPVQLSKEPLSVYASVVKAWLGQSGLDALLRFLDKGSHQ